MTGWSVYDEEPTPEPYPEEILADITNDFNSVVTGAWTQMMATPLRDMARWAQQEAEREYQRKLAIPPALGWSVLLVPCSCGQCPQCRTRSVNELLEHYIRSGYEWSVVTENFTPRPDMDAIRAKYKGSILAKPPHPSIFGI